MGVGVGTLLKRQKPNLSFTKGLFMTLLIALLAKALSLIPFLSIMGQLVLAILLGMMWRASFGVRAEVKPGIAFSSKKLLRAGIVLLGMRLNLYDVYQSGVSTFFISVLYIILALMLIYGLSRWAGVGRNLGMLTACGTAICGASAIMAISTQIKAKDEETAVSAATIAVLGTLFTLVYTLSYPLLSLTTLDYGVFAGATLHEVAHVIAAASAGGDAAVDNAVIVKLTRVALLVPVAVFIGFLFQRKELSHDKGNRKRFAFSIIPWFIFGFLAMSGVNTLGVVSAGVSAGIVEFSYLLIGMAMAGLGMNVDFKTFRQLGLKTFIIGLIGSLILSIAGFFLVMWMA